MVVSLNSYNNSIYAVSNSSNLNGVVRISSGGYYGSGTLLYGGMAVLTAAHLFESNNSSSSIVFDTTQGKQTIASSAIKIMPQYDANDGNNDLAIVWLASAAPHAAQRYELFRSSDDIGSKFTAVGYGTKGIGLQGETDTSSSDVRLQVTNKFETEAGALKDLLGSRMAWTPQSDAILVADFDNGTSAHDALGLLMNINDLGYGNSEGMIAQGDSGGPAFIDGKVAGIASYVASLEKNNVNPDIDTQINSSFGEEGFWQRVSNYQQWIDQTIREHYTNAPQTPQQVQKNIVEGALGTITVNYFLVEVTGMRSNPNEWLSVKYTTRDGTAISNQDYLPVSGTLVLYPNENHAVIPVEIIGDNIKEANETFYLDIFDPIGASFGNNQIILTAQRTILNDDGIA
ncbi:MAG: trypsin-like serine protease [Campylobacterales bacterium]|nr:trypsin-like serine protease [Campylobacterales bacterium]